MGEKQSPEEQTPAEKIAALLVVQERVIARRQELAAGGTRSRWNWKLERQWQSAGEGVAIAHRGTPTEAELRWAAVLHAGATGALAGDVALAFFGVKRLTITVHDVAVSDSSRIRPVTTPGLVMEAHRLSQITKWRAGPCAAVHPRPCVHPARRRVGSERRRPRSG